MKNRINYYCDDSSNFTGTVCHTPTFLSRCLAGYHNDFFTAFNAASSSPVFGIPYKTLAAVTRPFIFINALIYIVPSIPAS